MEANQDKCIPYLKPEGKDENFSLRPRQDLCVHRFDEYNSTNGILLLHNVGSGKTVTSLTLAINSIDWEAPGGPESRIILVLHPTGLFVEFMSEIQSKILNIRRLPYGQANGRNNECITDSNGIRRYRYEKLTEFKRGANWQANATSPQFFIESIQYNELAKYFAKYDESIATIRSIFNGKIVIIDEAHRLFRQFDICDKSSMIITKYINDNLLGGAKKIIAMTGTPLKNSITDMLSLFKLINIANITNEQREIPKYQLPQYQLFDITNKATFKTFKQTTSKTIDPRLISGVKCAYTRTAMAFYDFINADRSDLSKEFPGFTDKFVRDCAKLNFDASKKGVIVGVFEYVKLLVSDVTGYGRPTSVNKESIAEKKRIVDLITNRGNPQPGGKRNKTKKMRGGNVTSEKEARAILQIPDDLPKTALIDEAKKQYRKLAIKYHPDRNPAPGAKEMFQKILNAYNFITSDVSGETGTEEEKDFTYYYSIVANNVFFTTLLSWSDDELILFKKNMEYILLNSDFKYFSTYDLLVEFAAYDPFEYIDLLTENLEDIKNVTLSEIKNVIKNYENETTETYKMYFKTDYEMFNNLYVEKEPIKFIESVSLDESDKVGDGSLPKGGADDINESEYVNLIYGDLDFSNEIEQNSLLNKIKNSQNDDVKLNNLIGNIPPEASQFIKDNSEKINKISSEIQPILTKLMSKFELLIEEEKKENNMITQNGGMPPLVIAYIAFQVFGGILKGMNVDFATFIQNILSEQLAGITTYLLKLYNFTFALPETIGKLIGKGLTGDLSELYTIIKGFCEIIKLLPTPIIKLFALLVPLYDVLFPWKNYILVLISLYGVTKGVNWYYFNTSIYSLDKKAWFANLIKNLRGHLRKTSKLFSFYRSTPDDLAMLNIAAKNNWIRKRNRLRQELYKNNAFFEFNYDEFVKLSNPIVSTITVNMPQLNNEIYKKILNTNLYTVEKIYEKGKFFVEREFFGYPNRETMTTLFVYDTYQYYAFNQFKNISKELENNKYIDYINNFIPWYLNKKNLLDTRVIGNLSIDTSYPLSCFNDTTRSIVYFDSNTQEYVLNVLDDKVAQKKLNVTAGDSVFKMYKNVKDITFSCKKFEKILNYLILMKTGYMVHMLDNAWDIIPQPHLLQNGVDHTTISNVDNPPQDLYSTVHKIDPLKTHYFLPFVYSISDDIGLNLFAYFLKMKGYKFKVLHELTTNETTAKDETIKKSYPIINLEGDNEVAKENKKKLANFFVNNIVHSFNDDSFAEEFSVQLKAEPICILLHPFKTEGIDAKYNPAIFLLEPALNFGDYEQLCGRVLRTYDGRATYTEKPKKMIYQCLTSSRISLDKFYNNYSFLKKDIEIVEEDFFSVKNFFNDQNTVVRDPNTGYTLRNSWWSYYTPALINYTFSDIFNKGIRYGGTIGTLLGGVIGAVTPIGVGYGTALGMAVGNAAKMIPKPKNTHGAYDTGNTVEIKNGLVPNAILENAIYVSLEDNIYEHKKFNIIDAKKIDTNLIKYLKENVKDLDDSMQDLVEGLVSDKDEDITNSLKKSNYDLYNLLDEFIIKSTGALEIHTNYGDGSSFYWLRKQLEDAFGNEDDYFNKTIKKTSVFGEKYGIFMELDFKANKYEYSKLILKDTLKYIDAFKETTTDANKKSYNVSILLELIKFLKIIPNVDDFDLNNNDIGSEIPDFLSIKRTEFMFNKILTTRYETDITKPGVKTIPDLDSIIKSVNAIPDEILKTKIKFMPWCDTVSKRKYNRCNTTKSYFKDNNLNIYNLNITTQVKVLSDVIIEKIENNGDISNDKRELDNYYSSIYLVPEPDVVPAIVPEPVPDVVPAIVPVPDVGGAIRKMLKKRSIRKRTARKIYILKTKKNRKK